MNNSIQFRVNSYLQLARLCDDEVEKKIYITKATSLLEQYEETLSIKCEKDTDFDDWKVGIIENYLKDKNRVCLLEVWQKALYPEYAPRFPEMKRKDANSIVDIIVNKLNWQRGNSENFGGFGKQKSYYK